MTASRSSSTCDADDPERARLHLGPRPASSLRGYVTCEATTRVAAERNGTPVHVFARRRTVDDRLRALIEHRDGGCRAPGAGGAAGCTSTTSSTTTTVG